MRTRRGPRAAARRVGGFAIALLALVAPARAQTPDTVPGDTVRADAGPLRQAERARVLQALRALARDPVLADSLAADSLALLAADSLAADSIPVTLVGDSVVADALAGDSIPGDTAALARTGPPPPPLVSDSVTRVLLALPGYTAMEYSGEAVRYRADSARIELTGPAKVVQAGQSLTADSLLVYEERIATLCGYGKPLLEGESATGTEPVRSEQLCYDVDRQLGVARGARTQFTEGASWYLHGDVYTSGTERIYGKHTDFTTCDLEVPHYHFAARELKVVRGNVLVARDITLNFADVPVLWLPFMVQSLERGRRSGLLMPRFSLDDIARTKSNWNRRISNLGFYWAISDYMGAQLTGEWYANHWTSLEGRYDYNWVEQFLNGGLTFRHFWREGGQRDLTLSTSNSWRPDERTNVSVSANYASSSDFVRRNSFDPRELTRSIDSNVGLNRRFDWGTLTLSGQRRQFLSDDKVDLTLPRLGVSLSSITLFRAPATRASWYNNMTVSGSGNLQFHSTDVNELLPGASLRDRQDVQAGLNSSLRLGQLSWTQRLSANRDVLLEKPGIADTISGVGLPRREEDVVQWSTGLNYTQRLFGTTTLTPTLSLDGQMVRRDTLGSDYISAPARLNFGASMRTDMFGFFPGVGPFSRIRHRVSPTFSYAYSPAPEPDALQQAVFGRGSLNESNRIQIGLTQTFEAKYRDEDGEGEVADTAAADTAAADTLVGRPGEPRRLPQERKVMLLSINTSSIAYDFVRAREEGDGLATTSITNSLTSDLLRGLQLSFVHELFERQTGAVDPTAPAVEPERNFAPHLSNVTASFSLNSDSWIFRALGLSGDSEPPDAEPEDTLSAMQSEDPTGTTGEELGLIGDERDRTIPRRRSGRVGTWNASLNYTLFRPREGQGGQENQMLQGNLTFQPTENWNVRWRTGYSFTESAFSDHILSLTRDLHEWQASFDFVKAQNGNFTFRFRVQLTDLPDLHIDYDQRSQAPPLPLDQRR